VPSATPWYAGVQVPLAFTLTDSVGNAQDASGGTGTVVATVTLPDGTTATPTVSHVGSAGSGQYAAVYTTSQPGHHIVTWSVPGTIPGSYTDSFEVQPATDQTIVSLAEAKEILKLTGTAQYDPVIQGYNGAVTSVVEYYCGPVVQQTVSETLPSHGTELMLSKPPVIALIPWASVPAQLVPLGITLPVPPSPMIRTRVYGIEWPMAQLYVDNERGIVSHTSGLPFFYCAYIWQYTAGRPIVPWNIYEASKVILKHLYAVERGGQPAGTQAAYGQSEAGVTMTPFGFAIPNRAIQLMRPSMGAASSMVAV